MARLGPSTAELNLLLEWPGEKGRPYWALIFGCSIVLHVVFFAAGVKVPRLLGAVRTPERELVYHHIPLYLPPDVMTQKAPNKQKVSKQIDLADLQEKSGLRAAAGPRRRASERHFEVPSKPAPRQVAHNTPPQILPQAPDVKPDPNTTPPAGVSNGIPAAVPPPPSDAAGPFQNIGADAPPNPNPKLLPPRNGIETAIDRSHPDTSSPHFSISDDVPERTAPGNFGTLSQAPAQHAAVELESDPNGADFKNYLRTILTIVRGNWRRVIPESARMGALRGRTVVEFIISRDGSIPKLVTAGSSGHDPLDRAAIAGLSMSNPLPPLPTDYKGFQIRLAFTFAYNMPAK